MRAILSRRRVLGVLAALALAGLLGAPSLASRLIAEGVGRSPNHGRTIDPAADPGPATLRASGIDRQLRVEVGPPAASLHVWVVDPWATPLGTIAVLHGIGSDKTSQVSLGLRFAREGLRAVLVDLRGHGRSTGDLLTYGSVEGRDLVQVLDALEAEGLLAGPVGLYGSSYGGAVALVASADPRVAAVVTVSAFADLRPLIHHYAESVVAAGRFVPAFVLDDAVDHLGDLGGFDPDRDAPVRALERSRASYLIFHAAGDRHIPPAHAERLRAAAPERSRVVLVPETDHATVFDDRDGRIAAGAIEFFREHLVGEE